MKNAVGIKHVEFWVSDLKRSLKFYKNIFALIGWRHLEKNAFTAQGLKIYFVEQGRSLQKTLGPRHICFYAASRKVVEAVGKYLDSSGNKVIRGPAESRYENRESFTVDFKDPDGYIIEVATPSVVKKLSRGRIN